MGSGFPGGSGGKESACKAGDLGLIPGLGRSLGEGKRLPTPVFWPGEFHGQNGYTVHAGHRELDTTERLSFSYFSPYCERVSKSSSDRRTLKAHLFCFFLLFSFWRRANRRPPVGARSLMPSRLLDKHQDVISFTRRVVKTPGGFNGSACKVLGGQGRGVPLQHTSSPLWSERRHAPVSEVICGVIGSGEGAVLAPEITSPSVLGIQGLDSWYLLLAETLQAVM